MSQSIGIKWESSGTFGYREWSSDYISYVLDQLNQTARQRDLQGLDTWIVDDAEVLEEMLDACAESLRIADVVYPDSNERQEFQRNTLRTMQDIERRLQQLDTQTKWHNPSDALKTIRGLVRYLRETPEALSNLPTNGSYLIDDLERLEQLLTDAERDGTRFAFDIV